MIKIILIVTLVFTWSLNTYSQSEKRFWNNFSKGKYKKAGKIAKSIAEKNIDYLFLSAICEHNQQNYELYHHRTGYFKFRSGRDYSSLKDLLNANIDTTDYSTLNICGQTKSLLPKIELPPAKFYFEKSIRQETNNPIAYNFLAMIAVKEGNFEQGIRYAKTAIAQKPEYPEPYNNLAFAYFNVGKLEKAIQTILDCMAICPKNTNNTYANFIQLACDTKDLLVNDTIMPVPVFVNNKIRETLIKTIKNKSFALLGLAHQLHLYHSYEESGYLLDFVDVNKKNLGNYYFLRTMNALISNDSIKFVNSLHQLVKHKKFYNIVEIGDYFLESNDYKAARKVYLQAQSVAKSKIQKHKTLTSIGAIELRLKNYAKAIELMEKAMKLNPEHDIALTILGIAYHYNGNNSKAKKNLLKARQFCQSAKQLEIIDSWLDEIGI